MTQEEYSILKEICLNDLNQSLKDIKEKSPENITYQQIKIGLKFLENEGIKLSTQINNTIISNKKKLKCV